jgi:hypothetical protein
MAIRDGVDPDLAVSVVHHETGGTFDIHQVKQVPGYGYDYGVMQVNSTNKNKLTDPSSGFGFQIDTTRVQTDWKYNVYVGMALLSVAFKQASFNLPGGSKESVARETYAHYNAPKKWRELYTQPGKTVYRHVELFMKSWSLYNHD